MHLYENLGRLLRLYKNLGVLGRYFRAPLYAFVHLYESLGVFEVSLGCLCVIFRASVGRLGASLCVSMKT